MLRPEPNLIGIKLEFDLGYQIQVSDSKYMPEVGIQFFFNFFIILKFDLNILFFSLKYILIMILKKDIILMAYTKYKNIINNKQVQLKKIINIS